MKAYKVSPSGALVGWCEIPSGAVPEGHITEPPPATAPGQVAVWNGASWGITSDYRGQAWHNPETGEEIVITDAPQDPPYGWVPGPAPVGRTLAQARSERIAFLRARRESQERAGFVWGGSTFDSDDKAQMRIMGLAVAASAPAFEPATWRLADNTWRTLSASDALAVWGALQAHIRTQFETFAAREAMVNAAATVAEVDAITWENPQ